MGYRIKIELVGDKRRFEVSNTGVHEDQRKAYFFTTGSPGLRRFNTDEKCDVFPDVKYKSTVFLEDYHMIDFLMDQCGYKINEARNLFEDIEIALRDPY